MSQAIHDRPTMPLTLIAVGGIVGVILGFIELYLCLDSVGMAYKCHLMGLENLASDYNFLATIYGIAAPLSFIGSGLLLACCVRMYPGDVESIDRNLSLGTTAVIILLLGNLIAFVIGLFGILLAKRWKDKQLQATYRTYPLPPPPP